MNVAEENLKAALAYFLEEEYHIAADLARVLAAGYLAEIGRILSRDAWQGVPRAAGARRDELTPQDRVVLALGQNPFWVFVDRRGVTWLCQDAPDLRAGADADWETSNRKCRLSSMSAETFAKHFDADRWRSSLVRVRIVKD